MQKLTKALVYSLLIVLATMGCSSNIKVTSALSNDTTINGKIILRNSLSVEKNLGDIMTKIDEEKDIPDIYFKNKSGTEYLRLFFYPGDAKNEISFIEVSGVNMVSNKQTSWPTEFPFFNSESGIKLGMSKTDVLKKKGEKFETSLKDGLTIIRYNTDEVNGKEFLARYNMPFYSAEYRFKDDILVQFAYGFENP